MTSCSEYVLDDIMAIIAVPLEDFAIGTSAWQLTPTIPHDMFSPNIYNAVTIGVQPATVGGTLIPIRFRTGKAKDDESYNVAGRLHTVNVSCEVDDRDGDVWDNLIILERTPSHLLLTFRNGQRAFVSATKDTYLCSVERDGGKTSVAFRIYNLMGIQLLV